MGLITKNVMLAMLMSVIIFPSGIFSQNEACAIFTPDEPDMVMATRYPSSVEEVNHILGTKSWTGIENARVADDVYLSIDLERYERTHILRFSNFGFNVPDHAIINGLRIGFEGQANGGGNIKQMQLQFYTNGPVGDDRADLPSLLGEEWVNDSLTHDRWWKYGHFHDTWGRDWSASEINSSDFGFVIQIENQTDEFVQGIIDQLRISIYYTPPFNLCDHECVIFSTEPIDGVTNYSWSFPNIFEQVVSPVNQEILNLNVLDNVSGTYQVCVTPEGHGQCCRDFEIIDCSPGSVGDRIWKDENNNGIQDPNENGVPNVRVQLFNESGFFLRDQFTDSNGNYLFDGLHTGNYKIKTGAPTDDCKLSEGLGGDENLDSNYDLAFGSRNSGVFHIAPGQHRDDIDFGWSYKHGALSGCVFRDRNGDTFIEGEPGMNGITVNLYSCDGVQITSTITNEQGIYKFEALTPGSYYVGTSEYPGFVSAHGGDSAFGAGSYSSSCIDVLPNSEPIIKLGLIPLGSLGDYAFYDENSNGIQDMGDWPIPGLAVSLLDENNNILSTTTTNDEGNYLFTDLPAANYFVVVSYPSIFYLPTITNAGDPTLDSEGTAIGNLQVQSGIINLFDGETELDHDFGFVKRTATVDGTYVSDSNGDGNLSGEQGIPNVSVFLYNCNSSLISTRITDNNGYFSFITFVGDDYHIVFSPVPGSMTSTVGESDIDNVIAEGATNCFNVPDETTISFHGAAIPYSRVGDMVWEDVNSDGIYNQGEPGKTGVEISLLNSNNDEVSNTITNSEGRYIFDNILPGSYYMVIDEQVDFEITESNIGADETIDSDAIMINNIITSESFQLDNGNEKMDMDFGFKRSGGNITGVLWYDGNGDSSFEIEGTIANRSISLKTCDGDLITSTVTNTEGAFGFDNVTAGDYYIIVENVDGYIHALGGDSDLTSTIESGSTNCFTVVNGSSEDFLFGSIPTSSIGDYIWFDENENGIQDESEQGLENVLINLLDNDGNTINSTQSDSNGSYSFDSVPAGIYSLSIEIPTGYNLTESNVGDSNQNSEGVILGSTIASPSIELRDGIDQNDHDFGFIRSGGNITGVLWYDGNGDSNYEIEGTIANRSISLMSCDGDLITSTVTNEEGAFGFNQINAGDYYIIVESADGYIHALGGDSDLTSTIESGSTNCFTLTNGLNEAFVFGAIPTSSIGDYIWVDGNKNGIQDANEQGIGNVLINLLDNDGNLINSTQSDGDGNYAFDSVPAGIYSLNIEIPSGYNLTESNIGDPTLNSEGTSLGSIVASPSIEIKDGLDQMDHDFGFYLSTGSFQGTVWRDSNGDELFNNEFGLEGITITLYTCDVLLLESQITDVDGNYSFENIPGGDYFVVATLPAGFEFALSGDSQITNSFMLGSTDCGNVSATSSTFQNVGLIPLGSIGDFVWFDENENGLQDIDEAGIANLDVGLINEQGALIELMLTDDQGRYSFDNLRPGQYSVSATLPGEDYTTTIPMAGDSELDSEGIMNNGAAVTEAFLLFDGIDQLDHDFGFILKDVDPTIGSITGSFKRDGDGDGILNDEPGIADASITLVNCATGGFVSKQTDNLGNFEFSTVLPGEYLIRFPELENFEFVTFGESQITNPLELGATECFTILANSTMNILGGSIPLNTIGDYVWNDENKDGIQDESESGIEGIAITLFNSLDIMVGSTTSDENGFYEFNGILPGGYYTSVDIQDYKISPKNATTPELDSDLLEIDGLALALADNLSGGITMNQIDFGLYKESTDGGSDENEINGIVFEDLNGNGVLDDGEERINGITVNLMTTSGSVMDITQSASSINGDGYYEFTGFPNEMYRVEFELDGETFATASFAGTNPTMDSDIRLEDGIYKSSILNFTMGGTINGVNAGFYYPVSIGDFVWFDFNGDGLQDADEPGANDYLIRLYNGEGEQVMMTTTNMSNGENGYYSFNDLSPGDYYIGLNMSFGTSVTIDNAGDETIDSDVDNSNGPGTTSTITLISGDTNMDTDIGILSTPGSVGNFLWIDNNGNGIQDNNEPGVNDVSVMLYDGNSNLINETITADNDEGDAGYYLFENVTAGDYFIVFDLPEGYLPTAAFRGGNSSMDSDVTGMMMPGSSNIFSIGSGVYSDDIDCGIYLPSSIGDYVWDDSDKNGVQKFGEFGISDVEIILYRMDEGEVERTITGLNGFYTFSDLRPGEYYFIVEMIDDFQFTKPEEGSNPAMDSNVDMTGTSDVFYLDQDEIITNLDAGLVPAKARLGGRTWFDDGNGLQDFLEESLTGITVNLLDDQMNVVQTTETNVIGRYTFTNLMNTDYFIEFELPAEYSFTALDASFNDFEDSDVRSNGLTEKISVDGNTNLLSIDAGYVLSGLIEENIEELTLTGYYENGGRTLTWMDENFTSGDQYAVLRSYDGINFTKIDEFSKSLESNLWYQDFSQMIVSTDISYKVQKYLNDKIISESNIWKDQFLKQYEVKTYPVPSNDVINVSFDLPLDHQVELKILDLLGNELQHKVFDEVEAGNTTLRMSLNELSSGTYLMVIDFGDIVKIKKITIAR